jgi:hypothetical protein
MKHLTCKAKILSFGTPGEGLAQHETICLCVILCRYIPRFKLLSSGRCQPAKITLTQKYLDITHIQNSTQTSRQCVSALNAE